MSETDLPTVVIVGGGFAGLAVARALSGSPVAQTMVDRRNHHVFQPLLYQVATAALSPSDIASPIRYILSEVANCRVVLAQITGIDLAQRRVLFEGGASEYDWLVLAAGATHSYFGHDEWAAFAPGLKSIEDAIELRKRILLAFESAEYEGSEPARRAALTFAIVGGGPTGVELAGAIKEIAAQTIPADFRHIDTTTTRVVLLHSGDRLLESFPEQLGRRAQQDLERMGVEVRLNSRVSQVGQDGVYIGGEHIPVQNVFWAAGVRASPLAETLGVPLDRAGRVRVGPDLSVPGYPQVFVVGDMAAAVDAQTGAQVPGVAQGALQMGQYVGQLIAAEVSGQRSAAERQPFHYRDKGSMATIGRARAVAAIGRFRFTGLFAWLLWACIHIAFLIGFRNRIKVLASWLWYWTIFARDSRLITGNVRLRITQPREGEVILQRSGVIAQQPRETSGGGGTASPSAAVATDSATGPHGAAAAD